MYGPGNRVCRVFSGKPFIPVYQYTSIPVYQYTGIPVYREILCQISWFTVKNIPEYRYAGKTARNTALTGNGNNGIGPSNTVGNPTCMWKSVDKRGGRSLRTCESRRSPESGARQTRRHMTGYSGPRDYVRTPHIPLKNRLRPSKWKHCNLAYFLCTKKNT